ncbi:MAG: hypothetical protein WAL71_12865 [Terriglobales bacterium]
MFSGQATPGQRRTLLAASLGWMLDSFDAMLYALVLTHVMRDLGTSKATAGLAIARSPTGCRRHITPSLLRHLPMLANGG